MIFQLADHTVTAQGFAGGSWTFETRDAQGNVISTVTTTTRSEAGPMLDDLAAATESARLRSFLASDAGRKLGRVHPEYAMAQR